MSDIKLLPCPFCGGKTKLDGDDSYMFCCYNCGAGIAFSKEFPDGTADTCDKDESIEKWNTRKPMDDIVEQLESTKGMCGHKCCENIMGIVKAGGKE